MKVLFVINNFFTKGNGLAGSARRTVKKLREAGVDVKVLSAPNPDPDGPQPEFKLKDFTIPFFNPLVKKQGYSFSNVDKEVITEAVEWADVIHLEEPFLLQLETCRIAEKLGKPLTATYHLHPENLYASAGLDKSRYFVDTMMAFWRDQVFNRCKIVQCPTENVRQRLEKWKYKSELRVISNGLVVEDLIKRDDSIKPLRYSDAKYVVITIGRLSVEKDIRCLIESLKYSKFCNDIQLVIAGRGPRERALKGMAYRMYLDNKVKYPPMFGFFTLDELQRIALSADLYVHCAYIEVEGLSCMEAIQTGLVPVIAAGKLTATSQFALDKQRSVYKAKSPRDLALKMDYWLEHEEERKKEAQKYLGIAEKYDIKYSIEKLIEMFEDAQKE